VGRSGFATDLSLAFELQRTGSARYDGADPLGIGHASAVRIASVEERSNTMSSFSTRPDSDVEVVTFESAGGLNDFRNSALRDALYELVATHNDPMLAIDLAKVDYLSSSGVAILVGLKRRVETKGGKIVIFHVQPIVRDLLAVMKLDRFFIISEDEAKAIDSLRSLPPA
jgi:anti-sigma B factor antagonist